jgi:alpha-galactosidase
MLQIGNHGLTSSENRAHFFMWAILNAPLMAGTDLTRMTDEVRDLLIHPGVIAIDQDWGGSQGQRISFTETSDIWSKPMSDGGAAAVLLNKSDAPAHFDLAPHFESFDTAFDVFTGSALSVGDKIEVAPRDAVLIRFT